MDLDHVESGLFKSYSYFPGVTGEQFLCQWRWTLWMVSVFELFTC